MVHMYGDGMGMVWYGDRWYGDVNNLLRRGGTYDCLYLDLI